MKKFLLLISAVLSTAAMPALAMAQTNSSLSGSSSSSSNFPYCNGDYVIPGGVTSTSGVTSAYSYPRVSHVYSYFGISQTDMNNFAAQAQNGTVYKNGEVRLADGKLVATNANTAGCQNISGSTTVNDGYMTFYTRPTGVSFASSALSAYVVMKNGQFDYAILTSCGNPVKATPVTSAAPAPVTPKVKSTTTTAPVTQTQTQTQTVVVNQPAPVVSTAAAPAPAPAHTLPNTGASGVAGLAVISTVIGTAGHFFYTRRRLV